MTTTAASKSEVAYEWIRSRITGHMFSPGYRLVLGSIAEDLKMSVVPVREAIRRLEAEGLVTFERNVGARVTLVDESEYAHTMQTLGLVEGCATAFHSVLFEPCPNPHLLDLVHRGWSRLSGIRDTTFASIPGRAQHSVEEHTEILELIRAGADPLEIELAARNHRWRTMDAFLDALHTRSAQTTSAQTTSAQTTGDLS
jgi:DNA-binding GntR family transcriptional regulator